MSSGPQVTPGKKRSNKKLSHSIGNDDNEIDFIQLKRKCLDMETRLHHLETIWMRRYIGYNFINVTLFLFSMSRTYIEG